MKKQEVVDFYIAQGYKKDSWGNYCKTAKDGTTKKIKFKERVFKISYKFSQERLDTMNDVYLTSKDWVNTLSLYYSEVRIVNGKITNKKASNEN